jgi:hypothetical protein
VHFRPGEPLAVALGAEAVSAALHYRQVNQAERFLVTPMDLREGQFHAAIPADYTKSPFPLQYYFEVRKGPLAVSLYPGLKPPTWGQPYFVSMPVDEQATPTPSQ